MSVLVLGDGLLGSELVRQTGWDYISRRKDGFDITEPWTFKKFFEEASGSIKYSVVVNCIANTDTYSEDISSIRETNFSGPFNLVPYLDKRNIKLVQISSDYVYTNSEPFAKENSIIDTKGTNVYTFYKQALDKYLNEYYPNTLICRCSFKPLPFPYEKAWEDLIGNFDYVDVIAGLIIRLINKDAKGIFNIGTEVKSIYDLAKQTRPDVLPIHSPSYTPKNITMDLTKLKNFLNIVQ